ncbi:hypothetical protein ACWCPI_17580 [Streptomyces sp. NPDC001920]
MRQTLAKGLLVAAATSALSLYGTWSSAAPGMQGAAVKSGAALSSRTDVWDPGALEERLDDKFSEVREKFHELDDTFGEMEHRLPAPAHDGFDDDAQEPSGHGYGPKESSDHGYGPKESSDHGYGPKEPTGKGYGPEESNGKGYGPEEPSGYGYGPEEPSEHGYGYGPEEPTEHGYGYGYGYGDETHKPEPTPTKTATPPPSHKPTPTPGPSKTPPAKPERPQIPETGAGSVIGGIAASGALLVAGTVLYRRGRRSAASRR